jgi:cell division protein FtsQ
MRQLNLLNGPAVTGGSARAKPKRGAARRTTRRRGQLERWRRRAPKLTAIGLGAGALLTAAIWLAQPGTVSWIGGGIHDVFVSATAGLGMTVQRVYTDGRRQTPPEAILTALGAEVGKPIFAVDPSAARDRLQDINWIERATVERRLPSTVFVHLVERKPFALWQRNSELVVIDRSGAVIGAEPVSRFAHLPIVVGGEAPLHAPALLDAMATDPLLSNRVQAAIWIGGRRWNLRFDTGLEARLPEGDIGPAWDRLATEISRRGLLDEPVVVVDLRFTDRTILRMRPPTPPAEDET